MCWSLNHQNIIEMAQGHISLSPVHARPWGIPSGIRPKVLVTEGTIAHSAQWNCHWGHDQGPQGPKAQYFTKKPRQTLEKLLQKMDEYIRADHDFRQRREEAYRFSEMTRGFGGRIHPRNVRSIHSSSQNDNKGSQLQRPQYTSQSSGQQQSSFRLPAPRGRCARGFRGRYGDQPRKIYCLFCGEAKGHSTRICQIIILKQKEIAEAAAQKNQPKQVLHTASYHSPYIPEYMGNHPAASVASASHSQASWPQLPPPPPLQPTYSRGQQPEGRQHSQQQREFREESEAHTVNSTVPESKHIYWAISCLWNTFMFYVILFFNKEQAI
jgi:hypothetical protein